MNTRHPAGFTDGEWHVQDPMGDDDGDGLWVVTDGASSEVYDWRCIAIVTSDDPEERDSQNSRPILKEERDANARLIAKAPTLYQFISDNLYLMPGRARVEGQRLLDRIRTGS